MTLIEVLSVFNRDINAEIESISFLDKDTFEIEACFENDGTPQTAKITLYEDVDDCDCDLEVIADASGAVWVYNSTIDFFEEVRSAWRHRKD